MKIWTWHWHSADPVRGTRAQTTRSADLSTLAGGRIRTPLGGRLPCGPEGLRTGRPQLSKTEGANAAK